MNIDAFMHTYHSHTKYTEIDGRDFQMWHTVRLDLEARPKEVYIWSIVNTVQGNGQASKALDWLCDQADRYEVPLELFPERIKGHGKGIPTLALKKWYGSRGFVKDERYGFYRRESKMRINAAQRLITAGRETMEGAGALFYCPSTQRFLILLRADDGDDGNVWCCLGGGRDIVNGRPEPLETTVRRESWEEAGLPMDTEYELIHVGCKYYEDGFRFHNYIALIDEEFLPLINEEHKSFQWTEWENFPEEMHQGMMSVFNSPEGQRVLKNYTAALDY